MIDSLYLRHNEQDSIVNLKKMLTDIADAQSQLLNFQTGIQITNREIGEVVYSLLPIISPNYMELDGRTISESAYPNFYRHLRLLKVKYPEYFCSIDEYTAIMQEHHICPLFAMDEENLVVRVPRVSGLIEAEGIKNHGYFGHNTITDESIPNLKGEFGSVMNNSNSTRMTHSTVRTGVFSKTDARLTNKYYSLVDGQGTNKEWGAVFDASAYDSRYKDDCRLHQKSIALKCYMVIGRDSSYPHIVYSWHDEETSVRVYSDGYCQMEGYISAGETSQTVTYPYPLTSNVNVQLTPYHLGSSESSANYLIQSITNTNFDLNKERDISLKYIVSGYVDLSIIPVEVDLRAQSTDILEMMEYTKSIKDKMANTEIVLEMPENPDPNKMYIVVSPENVHVTQDVTNNFYGSSEKETYTGTLTSTFYHAGTFEMKEVTEHEVFTPNVSADNPTRTFTFTEFKSLPEVTELPENVSIKEITKNSVTIGYDGFTPDISEDNTVVEKETTLTEKGESISGDITQTFYHSGAFTSNTEDKEFTFDLDEETAVGGVYTLEFEELDAVPEVEFVGEIEILAKSASYVNVIGQGVLTITGTKTIRTFETEEKSLNVQDTIPLSKGYIEPKVILPENAGFSVAIDGNNAIVTYPVSGNVTYGTPLIIEKSFTFEVQEGHIELPDPENPSDPENPTDPSSDDPSKGSESGTSTIELSTDAIAIDGKETSETFTVTSNCELDVEVTNKGKINLKENNGTYTVSGNYDGTSEIKFTAKDGKEGTAEETSKTVTVTVTNCTDTTSETTTNGTGIFTLAVEVKHPNEAENVLTPATYNISYKEKDTTKTLGDQVYNLENPISVVKAMYMRPQGKVKTSPTGATIGGITITPTDITIKPKVYSSNHQIDVELDLEYLTPSVKEPYNFAEEDVLTPHTIHLSKRYLDISNVTLKTKDALTCANAGLDDPTTFTYSFSGSSVFKKPTHACSWATRTSSKNITCYKYDYNPETNDLVVWVGVPSGTVMAGAPIVLTQNVEVSVTGTLSTEDVPTSGLGWCSSTDEISLDSIDDVQLIHAVSTEPLEYSSKYVVLSLINEYKSGDFYHYYYYAYAFKNTEGVGDNYIKFYGTTLECYTTVNVQNAPSNVDTLEWTITQDSGSFTVSNGKVQYPCLPIMRDTTVDNAGIDPDDYEIYINGELSERKINKMDVLKMKKGDIVTVKRISDQAGWFAPYTFAGAGSANTNKNSYVKILTKELPVFTTKNNKPSTNAGGMFRYNYNIDEADVDSLFKNFKKDTTFSGTFMESHITRLMDISRFTKTSDLSSMYSNCTNLTISDNDAHYFDHIEVPVNLSSIFAYCTNINRIPEGMLDNPNITNIKYIMRRSVGGQQNDLDISTIPERYGMTLADISGLG